MESFNKVKVGSKVLIKVFDDGKIVEKETVVVSLKKYKPEVVVQYMGLTKKIKDLKILEK